MGSFRTVAGQNKWLPQYIYKRWGIHVEHLDYRRLKRQNIRMYSIPTGGQTAAIDSEHSNLNYS
jgi:hypothetical protein